MGIALDRLSSEERRSVAESLLTEVRPYKSEEVGSHCPFHREETPGGAFYYNFEMDAAYCHSCGANSDLVGIFNVVNGRDESDPEGCREFLKAYCPEGDRRKVVQRPRRQVVRREWNAGSVELPPSVWRERAGSFVDHAVERLQSLPDHLAELAAYGIDADTALKCKFGWNDRDKWPPLTSWGLPREENRQGKEKKVWLPEGLVMPAIRDGEVVKLKIRRPDPKTPWGEDRKYWEVKGGANGLYHVYGPGTYRVWVLVETERDAALIWSMCRGLGVGAMGCGGAAKRPCGFVADILRRSNVVLNALDFDQAGAKSTYNFWEKEFPNSLRWPVPPSMGKDAGEAAAAGLDLREWVLDGLPSHIRRKLGVQSAASAGAPAVTAPEASRQPATGKTHYEQVLEWMEPWPLWRDELLQLQERLLDMNCKIFRDKMGGPLVGPVSQDYSEINADEALGERFHQLRMDFHAVRVLDPELGPNSLENIVRHYFGSRLEVCR